MKCKRCHQEATFFYNEQSGGKALSLALCADCAAKAGFYSAHKDLFSPLFGAELSQGLFGAPKGEEKTACPDCGTTWQAMARSGKVGCPQCYNAFREELRGTIRQIHGNATHTGRAPALCREREAKATKEKELRLALENAIRAEEFEEAARLRDELRALGEA